MAGFHPAEIHWSALSGPEVPERDLYGEGTHAAVTLLSNDRVPKRGGRRRITRR